MRKYFLYEIEASDKPIFSIGEWEKNQNLTDKIMEDNDVAAYGEVSPNRYIALYNK